MSYLRVFIDCLMLQYQEDRQDLNFSARRGTPSLELRRAGLFERKPAKLMDLKTTYIYWGCPLDALN